MKPTFLYGWMRLARAMDKSEDIVFLRMDKETQLMVNIMLLLTESAVHTRKYLS